MLKKTKKRYISVFITKFAPIKHFYTKPHFTKTKSSSIMSTFDKNKWSVVINAILTIIAAVLNGLGFTIH